MRSVAKSACRVLGGFVLFGWGLLWSAVPALAQEAAPHDAGVTSGEVFRSLGIGAAVIGIVALVLVEFVFRRRLPQGAYRVALVVLLFALPIVVLMSATEAIFEETKAVASCNTCHVMEPFVADMQSEHSATLAAQHYQNKWIPKNQCYQCHTTYGVHGTLAGKRDGFRHWLLYVTRTWDEPIQYSGSYPNVNCYQCHGATESFQSQRAHAAIREDLAADRISCASCHGPPHPTPNERERLVLDDLTSEETLTSLKVER